MIGALGEVAANFDKAVAIKLRDAFGGRRLCVPSAPTPRLRAALGDDLAAWLCVHYGASRLYVPRDATSREAASASRIMGLTASGQSAAAIAAELGISERTVHRHRHRAAKIAAHHTPSSSR